MGSHLLARGTQQAHTRVCGATRTPQQIFSVTKADQPPDFDQGDRPRTAEDRHQYRAWLKNTSASRRAQFRTPTRTLIDHFDSLLLIDCWDEEWINSLPIPPFQHKTLQLYGRILDYIRPFKFDNVYASFSDSGQLHEWFRNKWPVQPIHHNDLELHIRGHKMLVAGQAWHSCLHNPLQVSYITAHKHNTVYSSPLLVTDHYLDKYDYASVHLDLRHQSIPGLVNDNSFANDPQCSWLKLKNQDLGLEQCPNNICPHNVWILEQVYD